MAISLINSQGMVLMVASSAIAGATPDFDDFDTHDAIGCPQSVGALEETRTVTEYKCMSSNETAKSLGLPL